MGNKDILRLKKKNYQNLSPADISKRIAKGSSLNRKEMTKEGTLKY